MSDALFTGAVRRRLGLALSAGPDPAGHAALTRRVGRNEAHNALRDKVIELLGWLGGLRVQNLDKPLADLSGTPFAGRHRPDLRAEEAGRAPVYVDVRYSHWWSLGESAAAAAFRRAAAATPLGVVQAATNHKLRYEYRNPTNSWEEVELVLGVLTTGGQANPEFTGYLRGCCARAATRQGQQGALGPHALASAFRHRVFGILSVERQRAVHSLLGLDYGQHMGFSRPEAGEPAAWEAWVAADGAEE